MSEDSKTVFKTLETFLVFFSLLVDKGVMVVLGCALDLVLLWVSAIIFVELMPQLLGLGVPGGP